jgi:hypothetical protein
MRNRVDHEAPKAIQGEDRFSHHQAADKKREFRANNGDHRQNGVFQGMFEHHEAFSQAFGPGCPDIVFTHDLQDGRARHAAGHRRIAVADAHDRPHQLRHVLPGVAKQRDKLQRGSPVEVDDQEENDQDPSPERGDGQAADADDAQHIIHPGILPDGGECA